MNALAISALGFFLGMRHATDPDHVVAITTIVARHRSVRGAALVGAVWGVGHTLTLVVVGGGIVLLGWVIPPRVGLSMELAVGLMLIVLGVVNLTGALGSAREVTASVGSDHDTAPAHVHTHAHAHGDYVHTHAHAHQPDRHPHDPRRTPVAWLDRHLSGLAPYQLVRPLIVGVVHGLAGSAAVALLVLTTINDPRWAVLYLLIFGFGTIAGMMLITTLMGVPFASAGARVVRVQRGLRLTTGVVSLVFGLVLAYQIGIVHGLFVGQPTWTPR
ncbi:MAG: hypothetical protein U0132_17615 [Gemmatimonadaceae bacterium]